MNGEPAVVHCDNHLLAVAKPAGVPLVPDASGDASLLEQAKAWVKRSYGKPGEVWLGVVHRLDRPVSGIVVFARTSKAAARLSRVFRAREVEKVYWGVVGAAPSPPRGGVEHWLVKDRAANRVRVVEAARPGARRAETAYALLAEGQDGSLVELRPATGRPHQLRVAMASLGLPLLGDKKYGAPTRLADRSIALHAFSLTFLHPVRGIRIAFEVPPPRGAPWRFSACEGARRLGPRVLELA